MKPKIAILGDSHTDNWLYIKQKSLLPEFILCISKASTASATGVMNKKSKSQSRKGMWYISCQMQKEHEGASKFKI